jgi:hypothetical protein
VAGLPLLGNFSHSAIFLHNFSLTNYYPSWEPKIDRTTVAINRNMKREEYTAMRSN